MEPMWHVSGFFRLQKLFLKENESQSGLELDLVSPAHSPIS
jgi:hypothetical protein